MTDYAGGPFERRDTEAQEEFGRLKELMISDG
jgi:hypothetical protein